MDVLQQLIKLMIRGGLVIAQETIRNINYKLKRKLTYLHSWYKNGQLKLKVNFLTVILLILNVIVNSEKYDCSNESIKQELTNPFTVI